MWLTSICRYLIILMFTYLWYMQRVGYWGKINITNGIPSSIIVLLYTLGIINCCILLTVTSPCNLLVPQLTRNTSFLLPDFSSLDLPWNQIPPGVTKTRETCTKSSTTTDHTPRKSLPSSVCSGTTMVWTSCLQRKELLNIGWIKSGTTARMTSYSSHRSSPDLCPKL